MHNNTNPELFNIYALLSRGMTISLYSETCVKWPLSKRPKIGFQDQLSLYTCQKQYFRPSWSYQLFFRSLFRLFLSGRFTHVLLYH